MPKRPGSLAGIAVLVLSVGVAVSLVGTTIIAAWQGRALSEQSATMLSTILGAVVGAIAGYLGGSAARCKPTDDKEP